MNKAYGIQAMRAIAALLVVVDHFSIHYCEIGLLPNIWLPVAYHLGGAGVCLFFAISGFVMVMTNDRKFGQPGAGIDFFLRRLIRIWPLYAIATLAFFAVHFNKPPLYTFENLARSLAFIPYIGEGGQWRPVLGKGWTLNYEMFFYAFFAICLFFNKYIGIFLSILSLAIIGFLGYKIHGQTTVDFYFNTIILYFAVGMLVALAAQQKLPFVKNAAIATFLSVCIVGLVVLISMSSIPLFFRDFLQLISIFAALYLVCRPETSFKNPLSTSLAGGLGDSSYALYLFHGFVFQAFSIPLNHFHNKVLAFAIFGVAVAASIAVCYGIHRCIELPTQNKLMSIYRSIFGPRKNDPSPQK